MGYQIGNIYFITAIAVIGGGLFGFDISSMSAIISTQQYLCYFNQGGMNSNNKCAGPNSDVQGGITAAMPGGSYVGAIASGTLVHAPVGCLAAFPHAARPPSPPNRANALVQVSSPTTWVASPPS